MKKIYFAMMFSKTFAYALKSLTYISKQSTVSNKLSVEEIAHAVHIPQHYLGKILQDLVRKGFLHSVKGPGGGFWTNTENRNRVAYDVLIAIDGDDVLSSCLMGNKECSHAHPCPLHEVYLNCRSKLFESLKNTSLKELAGKVDS